MSEPRAFGLHSLWGRFRVSPWRRVIELALIGLSLSLMLRSLGANLSLVDFAGMQVDFDSLLMALLITWITVYIGTLAWAEIIRALQPEVSYRQAVMLHLLSAPAKYLPGLGWQQVSKGIQLRREGVPVGQTAVALLVEPGLTILTGLATAAQILVLKPPELLRSVLPPEILSGLGAALWAVCLALPFLLIRFLSRGMAERADWKEPVLHLWKAELLYVIAWVTFGVALWYISRALFPLPLAALPYCIVALILSFIFGLVIIVLPTGLGVRELAMSALLQWVLPAPMAILSALMSRIILIGAEFLGVLPILIFQIWSRRT